MSDLKISTGHYSGTSITNDFPYKPYAAPVPAESKASGDAGVRDSYNDRVTSAYSNDFARKFKEFHDNEQCFGDELAREAFGERTRIKEEHQSQTSVLGRIAIWVRNLWTYGGANASYEGLSKTKTPEEIAYSAFKTDGKDLGLTGNGFGDKLEVWKAIRDVSTLYPEDVTPAMLAEYKSQVSAGGAGTSIRLDPNAILAAGGYKADPVLVSLLNASKGRITV